MEPQDYKRLLEENQKLKHLIGQFKNLLDSIPDPVFMKDENLRWIYGNPVILNLYSIDPDNYVGKTEDQLLPEEFAESCMESDRQAVAKGSISKSEERARDPEGNLHFYEVFKVPSYDKDGAFSGLIGVGRDITERKEAQEALEAENKKRRENEIQLAHLAKTLEDQVRKRTAELEAEKESAMSLSYVDTLTGLNNRRAYFEKSHVIDINARNRDCGYAVMIIDLDYFKEVNDTYGHAVGDVVLKACAAIIKENLRATDIEGRVGGEEFAVTLVDTTLGQAVKIAQKLCDKIAAAVMGSEAVKLTCSCGVTVYNAASKTFEDVLKRADEALYEAKMSGRNCVASKECA